jgi:hypothetical protein
MSTPNPFAFGQSAFGVGSFGPPIIYQPTPYVVVLRPRTFVVYDSRAAWSH